MVLVDQINNEMKTLIETVTHANQNTRCNEVHGAGRAKTSISSESVEIWK